MQKAEITQDEPGHSQPRATVAGRIRPGLSPGHMAGDDCRDAGQQADAEKDRDDAQDKADDRQGDARFGIRLQGLNVSHATTGK